jgi:hypothetical protein
MTDPVTGYVWPSIASHKIDYRHADGADPKWVWEVNRLLFLVPIAFALEAELVERDRAEALITETLTDWIATCRPGYGPQWAASIEVAIRSIAMTIAVQALAAPSRDLLELVGRSLGDHAAWIRRFPSAYSSANNHRVAELAALLAMDSSWSGILDAEDCAALEQELATVSRLLFASDGIGLEQSPTYGAFSLEFIALVLKCRNWRDETSRRQIADISAAASSALAEMTHEDGTLIRYGDDDEGKIVTVAVPEDSYSKSIVKLAGGNDVERHGGVVTFAEGGLSLFRFDEGARETTWLFDHGPLGYGEIAAHGHADVLSVSLRAAGVDWIVDAGTYRYHGDKSWRTYFRSGHAHNAPQLDGVDSSVMTGDFNWHPHKRAEGRLIASDTDGVRARLTATHDGYQKLGMNGPLTRTLERVAEAHYKIADAYQGDHRLSTSFILHPRCEVTPLSTGWRITRPESSAVLELSVTGDADLTMERPEDETAWFSPSFGQKTATHRLRAVCAGQMSSQLLIFTFKFKYHPPLEA